MQSFKRTRILLSLLKGPYQNFDSACIMISLWLATIMFCVEVFNPGWLNRTDQRMAQYIIDHFEVP